VGIFIPGNGQPGRIKTHHSNVSKSLGKHEKHEEVKKKKRLTRKHEGTKTRKQVLTTKGSKKSIYHGDHGEHREVKNKRIIRKHGKGALTTKPNNNDLCDIDVHKPDIFLRILNYIDFPATTGHYDYVF
jgi:hypothetical protein